MFDFAKNERGIRFASAAIVLLPVVAAICSTSRSMTLDLVVMLAYGLFAGMAVTAYLLERAEENSPRKR